MTQLANVARPRVIAQRGGDVAADGRRLAFGGGGRAREKVLRERQEIVEPIAESRNDNRQDAKPMIQVAAECPAADRVFDRR